MNRVTWDKLDEYYKVNNIIVHDVKLPEWGGWNTDLDTAESESLTSNTLTPNALTSNALIDIIREHQIKPNVKVTGHWEDEEKTILKIKLEDVKVKPVVIDYTIKSARTFTEEELKDVADKLRAVIDIEI